MEFSYSELVGMLSAEVNRLYGSTDEALKKYEDLFKSKTKGYQDSLEYRIHLATNYLDDLYLDLLKENNAMTDQKYDRKNEKVRFIIDLTQDLKGA